MKDILEKVTIFATLALFFIGAFALPAKVRVL
jgi:hypothetical protein